MDEGYVYLLCDGEKFKIGMTRQKDINKRIKELQTGNPYEIFLVAYHHTFYPHKIEKLMHAKFKPYNIKNEWFDLNAQQVNSFKNTCLECEKIIKILQNNPFF